MKKLSAGRRREAEKLKPSYLQPMLDHLQKGSTGPPFDCKCMTPVVLTFQVPAEIAFVAHDLRRFVDAMIFKLRKNRHKGRWDDYTVAKAMELLKSEVGELQQAINESNSSEILMESADVANFALILSNISIEKGK